ncbi:glyoxalase [Amylibacter kogurei]|uniref:Glyoxalase n=1 Tax=Paramylibacter kogurei TaxID=1889778 RepID=A0A2G5K8P0_9RHOB|nr:VOC family protein [Amylibacter kogurei]PIB25908.1 glyoxalase [Amylibacter kogurei]
MENYLEHANITVSDRKKTARLLCDLFDWKIRWEGDSLSGGKTIHVGGENSYVAVYELGTPERIATPRNKYLLGLNHIAVVVSDLDAVEKRVQNAGYTAHSHGDYEPGRRFYFEDDDGLEIEVVSYAQ